MALKKYKPTTPGRRQMSSSSFVEITKGKAPERRLLSVMQSTGGRNNLGRITVRHRGGGVKRRYRVVDFNRTDKLNIPGKVTAIEYDPNRTGYLMLTTYADGDKRYHLAPSGIVVGEEIRAAEKAKIKVGNRMQIQNIPPGFDVHSVEINFTKGGQIVRSAGSAAKITSHEGEYSQIQLPSGEVRYIHKTCYATIGRVSNEEFSNIKIGKAGRNRRLGKRPQVRGKAMNPVDHPHGGGEGSNSIGLKHPKTPWGMPALGRKTRRRKYTNRLIVSSRHDAKKNNKA